MSWIHSFLIYFREFFGATKKNIWNGKKLQSSAFFRQWFFKLNWIFLWARLRRFSGAASDIYCCFLYTFLVCAIVKSMFSFWLRCVRAPTTRGEREKLTTRPVSDFSSFRGAIILQSSGGYSKKQIENPLPWMSKSDRRNQFKVRRCCCVRKKKTEPEPKLNWIQNFLVSFTFPPMLLLSCFFCGLTKMQFEMWEEDWRMTRDGSAVVVGSEILNFQF